MNKLIDHTILKATATSEEVRALCNEAKEYDFASICVNTTHVPLVKELLKGTDVKTCCVVGFPLGANLTSVKAFEAEEAVRLGAEEVDMVINVGALKEKNDMLVYEDIIGVVDACKGKALVKVIIEACLLTKEEIVRACELAVKAKAEFVKTSTGFSTGGATAEDVRLMKVTVKDAALVKASGGVRTLKDLREMVAAGASRIGTSNGVSIMKEIEEERK